jgi:hypothetical protein
VAKDSGRCPAKNRPKPKAVPGDVAAALRRQWPALEAPIPSEAAFYLEVRSCFIS